MNGHQHKIRIINATQHTKFNTTTQQYTERKRFNTNRNKQTNCRTIVSTSMCNNIILVTAKIDSKEVPLLPILLLLLNRLQSIIDITPNTGQLLSFD